MIKRSCWKFPYNNYIYMFFKKKRTLIRNLTITSKFVNKTLWCYKGKVIGKLLITKQHKGHKLGEFFLTKVLGERIAYRKRLKLLLKKNKNKMKSLKKK
jgi:hypothetical protein